MGFIHNRRSGQRSWFGARSHRAGAAEIDPERHRGGFFRDRRRSIHAGDEGKGRQAHRHGKVAQSSEVSWPPPALGQTAPPPGRGRTNCRK